MADAKQDKLAHYATKELKLFQQFDGFVIAEDSVDEVMKGDKDGDSIWAAQTQELMSGANVRILVSEDTTLEEAVRLLEKLTNWIKGDGWGCVYRHEELPF